MPRILLVGWDDVSWKEATAAVCPRLDAFRATACEAPLTFSHPVCSQSRASILFGSYAKKIGTIGTLSDLVVTAETPPASLPTLPGVLAAAGYPTCLVGKWHCGPATSGAHWAMAPIERGYDEWLAGARVNLHNDVNVNYYDWERVDADAAGFAVDPNHLTYATQAQLQAAADWWAERSTCSKAFMHVAFNAPHGPHHTNMPAALLAGWPDPQASAPTRTRYLAMLRTADTAFGQLLDMVGPDTAVFLYSDNGTAQEVLAAGADTTHVKGTTFDGGTRVLGLGRWQGCLVGQTAGLQHVQDVAAGILAAAGLQIPIEWDAQVTPRSYVLSEARWVVGLEDRACRTLTHKLRQVGGFEELYDLVADPDELVPLDLGAPENEAVLAYLRSKLDAAAL